MYIKAEDFNMDFDYLDVRVEEFDNIVEDIKQ